MAQQALRQGHQHWHGDRRSDVMRTLCDTSRALGQDMLAVTQIMQL